MVRTLLLDAPAARSAATMALLDLEARQRDVPVWRLLGAEQLLPQPAVHIVSGTSVADEVADARRAYASGVRFFKLKAGPPARWRRSWPASQAITRALGDDAVCGADANEGLCPTRPPHLRRPRPRARA